MYQVFFRRYALGWVSGVERLGGIEEGWVGLGPEPGMLTYMSPPGSWILTYMGPPGQLVGWTGLEGWVEWGAIWIKKGFSGIVKLLGKLHRET